MAAKLLNCQPPSPVYALYLKGQRIHIEVEYLVSNLSFDLKEIGNIVHNVFSGILERQNLLCELYLHNFVFPTNTVWNPYHFVGDINLRAFQSYLQNEIQRERKWSCTNIPNSWKLYGFSQKLPLLSVY